MWWMIAGALAEPGKRAEWWYTGEPASVDGARVAPVDPVARLGWAKVALSLESPSARWAVFDLASLRGTFGGRVAAPRDPGRGRWLAVPPGGKDKIIALFEGEPPSATGWLVPSWTLELAPVIRLETDGERLPLAPLPLSGEPVTGGTASCWVVSAANGRSLDFGGDADVLVVTSSIRANIQIACANRGEDWLVVRPLRARLGGVAATGGPVAVLAPGATVVVPARFEAHIGLEGHLTVDGVVVRPPQAAAPVPAFLFAKDEARSRD